jgi:hypothetical protein
MCVCVCVCLCVCVRVCAREVREVRSPLHRMLFCQSTSVEVSSLRSETRPVITRAFARVGDPSKGLGGMCVR